MNTASKTKVLAFLEYPTKYGIVVRVTWVSEGGLTFFAATCYHLGMPLKDSNGETCSTLLQNVHNWTDAFRQAQTHYGLCDE